MKNVASPGFSIAEVLIGLAIMGIVAAFTVPAVFLKDPSSNTMNKKYSDKAINTVFMLSSAYQQYQMTTSSVPSSFGIGTITPYMNYVSAYTGSLDDITGFSSLSCTGNYTCFKLHNGGSLWYLNTETFGGTATTNAVRFTFDPETLVSGPKAEQFLLYYDGRVETWSTARTGSTSSLSSFPSTSAYEASWFSW